MGWFLKERGVSSKQSWAQNTLASMSVPPMPLIAVFFIIIFLFCFSSYLSYKNQMHQTVVHFKLFLLFLPVLLIFLAQFMSKFDSFFFPNTKAQYGSVERSWDVPWGVFTLVVVLIILASYRSSFRSLWSPIVWSYG